MHCFDLGLLQNLVANQLILLSSHLPIASSYIENNRHHAVASSYIATAIGNRVSCICHQLNLPASLALLDQFFCFDIWVAKKLKYQNENEKK